MEVDVLVQKCIKSAIEHGIAAYEVVENSRKTNRLYDKNFKNFKALKQLGNKGIGELEKLLSHPNDYVKYSSATHLLSIEEKKAKEVLKKLVNKPELFGCSVEMLLSEWDRGNLREYLN
jgi:transcriptional regulator